MGGLHITFSNNSLGLISSNQVAIVDAMAYIRKIQIATDQQIYRQHYICFHTKYLVDRSYMLNCRIGSYLDAPTFGKTGHLWCDFIPITIEYETYQPWRLLGFGYKFIETNCSVDSIDSADFEYSWICDVKMAIRDSEKAMKSIWNGKIFRAFRMTLFFVLFGIFSLQSAISHEGATGVVKERMDRFKASKESVKQIKLALKGNDWKTAQRESNALMNWAVEMSKFFPEDSNYAPSEAKIEIWSDWDGFVRSIESYQIATTKLVKVTKDEDNDSAVSAFKTVLKSCKGCHNRFKAD